MVGVVWGFIRVTLIMEGLLLDMTGLPVHKPFAMGDGRGLVTECVPYLKRQREGGENQE